MYHIGDFTFDTQKQLLTIGEKQDVYKRQGKLLQGDERLYQEW